MMGAQPPAGAPRHFLDLSDDPGRRAARASSTAPPRSRRDAPPRAGSPPTRPLAGKVLAMIFDKPSTRTRVSFDVGMRELGGETLMLTGAEMQLGRGETIADTARVLSRYVDAIMIRILEQDDLDELAAHATVPVINGLTKALASLPGDGRRDDLRGASRPDRGAARWPGAATPTTCWRAGSMRRSSFDFTHQRRDARPSSRPTPALLDWAAAQRRRASTLTDDPFEAVRGADAVISDCWVSMGDEDDGHRHNLLAPYQVNAQLMAAAGPDAIFMHCLPAHRGEEVTDEVIDGPQSVVFDEAENRLHAQKGILAWCLGSRCRNDVDPSESRAVSDLGPRRPDPALRGGAARRARPRGPARPVARPHPGAARLSRRRSARLVGEAAALTRAARLVAEDRGPLPAADRAPTAPSTCWSSISTRPTGCAPSRASTPTRLAGRPAG